MSDEDGAAEGRGDDHPPRPGPSGFEDGFWLVVLALIVVVVFLIGLMGADTGPANQDGYTGWH
ncbi:hypothetical protein [Streptomyces sp. NPDC013457]|uniref:hypothetical protein n=1 Tax=Streptomyces sp. NPDC013457 TaxID=3364866 RepID=UPI003701DBFD